MARNRTRSGGGKNQGQYSFAQIPETNIMRSTFNRSSGLTTTFDAGLIIPVYVDEILPGDTVQLSHQSFVRLATPIVPVMDNLYMDIHYWFVPLRLLWDNFQAFMGEQLNPGDHTDYTVPQINFTDVKSQTLADYFGIPIEVPVSVSALPFRAYNLIMREWYRHQDLVDSPQVPLDNGPDDPSVYSLFRRMKRHDYFTAAMPFSQKGPAVPLPLGGTAPITGTLNPTGEPTFQSPGGYSGGIAHDTNDPTNLFGDTAVPSQAGTLEWLDPALGVDNLAADLSEATAALVNDIRQAFQLQRMYEKDARGGTRYVEILRSHFGIRNHPDARLQRPEYLGGDSSRITFHPVAQTSQTGANTPQGNLASFATGSADGRGFARSFVEHGYVIGVASVRADQTYQYGVERFWKRKTRFDFYFPSLAHLGEQEVLNEELYADGTSADQDTFGYQERWAEYRYKPSKVTGLMRSYVSAGPYETLHYWHLAQDWATRPNLNQQFMEERPPIDRVVATPDQPDFLGDFFFSVRHTRPLPTFSVPGLMDHF